MWNLSTFRQPGTSCSPSARTIMPFKGNWTPESSMSCQASASSWHSCSHGSPNLCLIFSSDLSPKTQKGWFGKYIFGVVKKNKFVGFQDFGIIILGFGLKTFVEVHCFESRITQKLALEKAVVYWLSSWPLLERGFTILILVRHIKNLRVQQANSSICSKS